MEPLSFSEQDEVRNQTRIRSTNPLINKFFSYRCANDVLAAAGKTCHRGRDIAMAMSAISCCRDFLRRRGKEAAVYNFHYGDGIAGLLAAHLFQVHCLYSLSARQERRPNLQNVERARHWDRAKVLERLPSLILCTRANPAMVKEAAAMYRWLPSVAELVIIPEEAGRSSNSLVASSERILRTFDVTNDLVWALQVAELVGGRIRRQFLYRYRVYYVVHASKDRRNHA